MRSSLFALLLLTLTVPAEARVLRVDPVQGPFRSFAACFAVTENGDTVEVAPGTYTEILAPRVSLVIRSRDGAAVTILDGEGSHRLVESSRRISLTFVGITFQHGSASSSSGGAIQFEGTLALDSCTFRGNAAKATGGAVQVRGAGRVQNCLFVRNSSEGGAGALTCLGPLVVLSSTFLNNSSPEGFALTGQGDCWITHSLFAGVSDGRFWPEGWWPDSSCCLFWPHDVPASASEGGALKTNDWTGDPRICPGPPETLHETSPAISGWGTCDRIGSLPIGCRGPTVVAAHPRQLKASASALVRIYGYGLTDLVGAELRGPQGTVVTATRVDLDDPWVAAWFDLHDAPSGDWTLRLLDVHGGGIDEVGFVLVPYVVGGWIDGWVGAETDVQGLVFGRNLPPDLSLTLVRQGGGGRRPVTIRTGSTEETLRVSADLSGLEDGVFDLEYSRDGDPPQLTRSVVYLGEPPVLRVPEEYPSVTAALTVAAPGSEIRIGSGTYRETLTIGRPVRLVAASRVVPRPTLEPSGSGQRVLHVLPEAGSLFEARGLWIRGGDAVNGPGGGIWLEAPGLVQDCIIRDCRATGAGARGGGIDAENGGRIFRCSFHGNAVGLGEAEGTTAPWSLDPTRAGAGGNLFCLDGRVEGCDFGPGQAPQASCMAVRGTFRDNDASPETSGWPDQAFGAVVRGDVRDNSFTSSCVESRMLLVDGPCRFERNNVCHQAGDLCAPSSRCNFRGSVQARENRFTSMICHVCLDTDPEVEPAGGGLTFSNNVVDSGEGGVVLHRDGDREECGFDFPSMPREPMDSTAIEVGCNRSPDRFRWEEANVLSPCAGCSYVPWSGIPEGCPATTAADSLVCEGLTPVLVLDRGLEPQGNGVRLWWRVSADVAFRGFELWREAIGSDDEAPQLLTPEPLTGCEECEFVDAEPPRAAESIRYRLDVLLADGARESHDLGEWVPTRRPAGVFWLEARPHPLRANGLLRFELSRDEKRVRLEVYGPTGRLVAARELGPLSAGAREIPWSRVAGDARPPAGVYLFQISTPGGSAARKLLLLP